MTLVNIHDAKTNFSKLINHALAGEDVVIAKGGKPLVRLVPYTEGISKRQGDKLRGVLFVPDDFDDPLPSEVLNLFHGEENS
ncbi:MAG: type II toxin-antitoxin system Phd/YefM family antitoxin [Gammaproteobacteria bacterium]